MYPVEHSTIRQRQHELLREVERERIALAVISKRFYHRQFAGWIGGHMIRWGQRFERFGRVEPMRPSPSPHH